MEITKEMIEKFISETDMELTLEEIEAMMDAETEKPMDEMDTELIDLCAAVLAKAYNPEFKEYELPEMYRPWEDKNTKPAKKKVPLRRILLVAAVLALVLAVALPVGAMLFESEVSDSIIGFYSDFFRINLNKDEPTAAAEDDAVNVSADTLESFMLPQALLSDEYEKSVCKKQEGFASVVLVSVNNAERSISGTITITKYNDLNHNMTNCKVDVPYNTFRYYKEISTDNKPIIVFGYGKESYINYSDGNANYQINLRCDFDTMVSIAETINDKG